MLVSMYVYMYDCMCMYLSMYVRTYVCMYNHTYIYYGNKSIVTLIAINIFYHSLFNRALFSRTFSQWTLTILHKLF